MLASCSMGQPSEDLEKTEIFSAFFASVFTGKVYFRASQVSMICGSVGGRAVPTRAGAY